MTFPIRQSPRWWLVYLIICVLSLPAWPQNTAIDSQNLRALLEEVRKLRHELQSTTVASQRVQIVLYRLQFQDAAVASAARLVEEAHRRLDELAVERQQVAAEVQKIEELRKNSQDAHEVKMMEEEVLPQMKRHGDRLAVEEERWRTRLLDAEAQLRAEQGKLDALHDSLDRIEQSLTDVANNPSPK